VHAAALAREAGSGERKRRRGGRGRGRGNGAEASVNGTSQQGPATKPAEKRAHGHQPVSTTAPAPAVVASQQQKKPGFFRRLGNLFKRS